MRNVPCMAMILALSACSGAYAPSPSGVDKPGPSLSDSGRAGSAALQENCTLTQGFWKNHEAAWPVEELILGGTPYTKAQLLAILKTSPLGDATYILIHQLIAAELNLAAGADPATIATAVAEADAWLAAHPLGSSPKGADREAGLALAALLDAYNNGVTGPGHCSGTPVPSPSATPSATPSANPGA